MFKKESRVKIREKKHMKIRNRFSGTPERPRLAVYRSNSLELFSTKKLYGRQVYDSNIKTASSLCVFAL